MYYVLFLAGILAGFVLCMLSIVFRIMPAPLPLHRSYAKKKWRKSKFDVHAYLEERRRVEDAVVLGKPPEGVAPTRVRTAKIVRRGVDPSK